MPPDTPASRPTPGALAPLSREGGDRFAARLRGFGPIGILAIIVVLLGNATGMPGMSGALALVWAWRSRTPWATIGYVRPRNWLATIAGGILLGATLKLFLKIVVMPLLGAPDMNAAYHYLTRNTAAIPTTLFAVIVGAGFGEETVFRGFAFERLRRLIGTGTRATVLTVVFTSLWFGIEHYPQQGLAGAEQATMTGLTFATIYARTGRLIPLMIAHASFDLVAYAIIYWDLETTVAHLVWH